jgi:hypothetical protein
MTEVVRVSVTRGRSPEQQRRRRAERQAFAFVAQCWTLAGMNASLGLELPASVGAVVAAARAGKCPLVDQPHDLLDMTDHALALLTRWRGALEEALRKTDSELPPAAPGSVPPR